MEDMFSVAYQQTPDMKDLEYAFFGIFDGHGGSEAATYAKDHLLDTIIKDDAFWSENDDDVLRAIRNGYVNTHIKMWKNLGRHLHLLMDICILLNSHDINIPYFI